MAEAIHEAKRYCFRTSEIPNKTPWIYWEPVDGNLAILGEAIIGFELKPGTSVDEADRIARYLNDNLANVSCTWYPPGVSARA